jgi:DNA transposition AAA+ family ATPase
MHESAAEAPLPFVPTSVARQLLRRLEVTHEECGIAVLSGPWGIGKTTAINEFQRANEGQCVVVKVEQTSKRGASAVTTMQYLIEAMRGQLGKSERPALGYSFWELRRILYNYFEKMFDLDDYPDCTPSFTLIFDEAQYLSRDAIEMLRYCNDTDRTTTPFPVGLVFIGNNEFALKEDGSGESPLSGAVRSRALFIEELEYADVTDTDLILFAQSRGVSHPAALSAFVGHFSKPKVKRDLRNADRLLSAVRRRAGNGAISVDIINFVLNPA